MTYNFDPDKWYENEAAFLENRCRSGKIYRSGFKTSNQVQSQGGPRDSNAGIYLIFRVLNNSVQHRNWALGEVLKPLLSRIIKRHQRNSVKDMTTCGAD
jgi:hypothetical protein